jgi:hypothetical protein
VEGEGFGALSFENKDLVWRDYRWSERIFALSSQAFGFRFEVAYPGIWRKNALKLM